MFFLGKPILYNYFEELKYARRFSNIRQRFISYVSQKFGRQQHLGKCFKIMEGFAVNLMTEADSEALQFANNEFADQTRNAVDHMLVSNGLQNAVRLNDVLKSRHGRSLMYRMYNRSYGFRETFKLANEVFQKIPASDKQRSYQVCW